jgi:hypothetical protein
VALYTFGYEVHAHPPFFLQAFALLVRERKLGGNGQLGFPVFSLYLEYAPVHDASIALTKFRVHQKQKASILRYVVDNRGKFRGSLVIWVDDDAGTMVYLGVGCVVYVIVDMN